MALFANIYHRASTSNLVRSHDDAEKLSNNDLPTNEVYIFDIQQQKTTIAFPQR